MNEKLKILIGLLVFLVMPVVMGVIVVGAFRYNKVTLLAILFFALVGLSLTLSIIKFVKNYKNKDEDE